MNGDAVSGYVRNGHYYLNAKGVHTEVSRAVWQFSYFHTISVLITSGCGIISASDLRTVRGNKS